MSGRVGVRPAGPLDGPIQSGGDDNADTGRHRVDGKIFQSRVPSRRPELQDFEAADPGDSKRTCAQPMLRIGQSKCEPQQHECERVLAVLSEVGVRPELRWSKRRKGDGCRQQPGEYSKDDCHRDQISRFIGRIARSRERAMRAWLMKPTTAHNASRTPRPSMKRSLICTGSRRVAPTPGLSSMRTPISVGSVADRD